MSFSIFDLAELYNFEFNQNNPHELSEIMSKYNSDKGYGLCQEFITNNKYPPNAVCHNYTYFYSQLFSEYRNENLTIFEMGVGVPSCMGSWAGSLLGWKEYFPNSTIFSADFDKNYLYCDERIKSYYVDQESADSINNDLWNNLQEYTFDIMVDDGPHTYSSNILFYKNSIHKLKTKGIYIIEDINIDFIDQLYGEILEYNKDNSINCNSIKLIVPWPENFTHPSPAMLKMNNLIILQKL
jgi:DNA-dependent RNA polymerase auxiliary subunit epsilon